MEGVTDAPMRALQGDVGAFSYAVTEFLRVSHTPPPRSIFFRHVPELHTNMHTATGLPVQLQLLGGDPTLMAEAAGRAVEFGATGIDLNFGCPAKTVNRHDGGATLLKHPTRLRAIVQAVRNAVPRTMPVSAKVRLGWDDVQAIHTNAAMAVEGGATWLTIHARTRAAGYAPPVDWPLVGQVRERVPIPVIANGDIWTIEDFHRCRTATGCTHFMLGRGALARPALVWQIAHALGLQPPTKSVVPAWPDLLQRYCDWTYRYCAVNPQKMLARLKQWLNMAAKYGPFEGFDQLKLTTSPEELLHQLRSARCTMQHAE